MLYAITGVFFPKALKVEAPKRKSNSREEKTPSFSRFQRADGIAIDAAKGKNRFRTEASTVYTLAQLKTTYLHDNRYIPTSNAGKIILPRVKRFR